MAHYSVQAFCERLAATPLSNMIQTVPWMISLVLWIGIVAFGRWIGFAAVP